MKILIAPTAFKGTLSPLEAARAIAEGLLPHPSSLFPVADGGNGWIEVWQFHKPESIIRSAAIRGPLGQSITAEWLELPDGVAIVESASACGLHLMHSLDPLNASSEGVGDLILEALRADCREIWLGLGGSASTDAGVGALRALGYEFLSFTGEPVPSGGKGLPDIHTVHLNESNAAAIFIEGRARLICATDVMNCLYGEEGAAFVFAPQKGASPKEVRRLDRGLYQFAAAFEAETGFDISSLQGGGAAGGLGAGLAAGLCASLISGIEWLLDHTRWHAYLEEADLVITGEGRVDSQTWMGKGIGAIAQQAARRGKRVWIVSGSRGEGWDKVSSIPNTRLSVCVDHFAELPPFDALKSTVQSQAPSLLNLPIENQ